MLRSPGLRLVDHRQDWLTQIRQYWLIHGGYVRSYADVAAAIGARFCPGPEEGCGYGIEEHEKGVVARGTVHWTPRRVTRHGLRNFLRLVARDRILHFDSLSRAMQIYAENSWASRTALEIFHVRFTRKMTLESRLVARWLISHGDEVTPPARRWASRS